MTDFVTYMFAPSAARLPKGVEVRIESGAGERPSRSLGIRSDFLAPPHDLLARGLLIEVRGPAGSLERAADEFLGLGAEFLPALSLTSNAFVDNVRFVAAYDVSPVAHEREWIQQLPDPEYPVPPDSREVSRQDFGALLSVLAPHPERDRVGLAIAYYREAIRHWTPGSELLAVEHLQIAAETITPVATARVLKECGLSRDEFAGSLGYDSSRGPRDRFIASRVRLEEIYGGQNDLRRDVERASNGYEHGLETFAEARRLAERSRGLAADTIRTALLQEAGVGGDDLARLTADHYRVPLRLTAAQHLWHGKLKVDDEAMLAVGTNPITMRNWSMSLRASEITTDGDLEVQADHVVGDPPDGASITMQSKTTIMPVGLSAGARAPKVTISQPDRADPSMLKQSRESVQIPQRPALPEK